MESTIRLYEFAYFIQGNRYTGSCTPERSVANPFADIFNYRVFCDKDDNGNKSLAAQYHIGCKSFANTDSEKIVAKSFEMSQSGISEAQSWLQNEYEAFKAALR